MRAVHWCKTTFLDKASQHAAREQMIPNRSILMRALPLFVVALLGLSFSTATQAQDKKYYVKVFGGASTLQDSNFTLDGSGVPVSFDTGFVAGGALGYAFGSVPIRTELEFAYRTGDASGMPAAVASGGDLASTSIMVNGYYMFQTATKFSPYLGLGLGYATEIDFDLDTPTGQQQYSDTGNFAYQLMLGTEYEISDRWALYGELRYFSASSVTLPGNAGSSLKVDYDTFDVVLGASLSF